MKSMRILLLGLLSIGVPGPATAQLSDSQQPGSVLVFPKFITGTFNDVLVSGKTVHAKTELEISVRCPTASPDCAVGQGVRLRAHWVCPGTFSATPSTPVGHCAERDFDLVTTVNGTLWFNPEGVESTCAGVKPFEVCTISTDVFPNNATRSIPKPPCEKGYLIVWVVNEFRQPIKFDGLIGDAILRTPLKADDKIIAHSARGYNAIAIQAGPGLATGDRTTTDIPLDPALHFDGIRYMGLSGRIVGTVRYENSDLANGGPVRTDLTLLTLDVVSNASNPVTTAALNFYDSTENITSASVDFICWAEKRLTDIDTSFTVVPMTRKGLVESDRATATRQQLDFVTSRDVSVLGLLETFEDDIPPVGSTVRDYAYSLGNDGSVVTTTSSAFPPSFTP